PRPSPEPVRTDSTATSPHKSCHTRHSLPMHDRNLISTSGIPMIIPSCHDFRSLWWAVCPICPTQARDITSSDRGRPGEYGAGGLGSAAEPGAGQAGDGGGPGNGLEPGRRGGQCLVLVVGEVDVGGGGVVFELLDTGCTRDRGHGRVT